MWKHAHTHIVSQVHSLRAIILLSICWQLTPAGIRKASLPLLEQIIIIAYAIDCLDGQIVNTCA